MSDGVTIVAIATPSGEGGVGMVRLSGPRSIAIGRLVFRSKPLLGCRPRYIEYGQVLVSGRPIDEALAWVLPAPRSYTGEDTVEISTHGSLQILEQLVQAAISKGAVLAQPGEFTRRAFLNGRLDLLQAEAVVELIQAGSATNLDNSYGHLQGQLSRIVNDLKSLLVQALSLIEVGLDFVEEDIDEINRRDIHLLLYQVLELTRRLLDTFEGSRRRQDGYLVALIGRPNVGKSTLLNAFLGEERAIVTAIPGTTRDLVEGRTLWKGEIVRLVDTAGLRPSENPLEKEGIYRSKKTAEKADFILAVLDASTEWCEEDRLVLDVLKQKPGLVLLNKTDKPRCIELPADISLPHSVVDISALTGHGLKDVRRLVSELVPKPSLVDGIGITRQRHRDCLERVLSCSEMAEKLLLIRQLDECIVSELQEALRALGEMLGLDIGEEVLDRIFADFCIGK